MNVLDVDSVYDLDRLDLTVGTTLDRDSQARVSRELEDLLDGDHARQAGLTGVRLLGQADASKVVYSFNLYERGGSANYLRVQADNWNQPLNINEGRSSSWDRPPSCEHWSPTCSWSATCTTATLIGRAKSSGRRPRQRTTDSAPGPCVSPSHRAGQDPRSDA